MDSAAADLELLIGVGEAAGEGFVASREGSEAVAEQAAGGEGRPARELRTAAGKDAGDVDDGGARRKGAATAEEPGGGGE